MPVALRTNAMAIMVITAHRSKLMARDELLSMFARPPLAMVSSFFWRVYTFENYTGRYVQR